MFQFVSSILSHLCGQNPDHTWMADQVALPCCQRCTGLYIGALMAIVSHLWLRPCGGKRFLQVHALFLLQLGLFAFSWMPSTPIIRTLSGLLFGFGTVSFLWSGRLRGPRESRDVENRSYWISWAVTMITVPAIATWGTSAGNVFLTSLVALGVFSLSALVFINVTFGISFALARYRKEMVH